MSKLVRIIGAGLAILLLIISAGLVQNYFNNPVRGCQKFDTGTRYQGYQCGDTTKYIPM